MRAGMVRGGIPVQRGFSLRMVIMDEEELLPDGRQRKGWPTHQTRRKTTILRRHIKECVLLNMAFWGPECVFNQQSEDFFLSSCDFHNFLNKFNTFYVIRSWWKNSLTCCIFLHKEICRQSNSLMGGFLYECWLNKSWLAVAAAWCRAAAGESWAGFNFFFALQPAELSPCSRCSTHAATPITDGLVKMNGKTLHFCSIARFGLNAAKISHFCHEKINK